jgi:plastocyanin
VSVWIGNWRGVVALAAAAAALAFAATPGQAGDGDAGASAGKTVTIRNFAFHPGSLEVNRGARVTFVNSSAVPHTATKGDAFDTRRIQPRDSAVVRFGRKGAFAYHCKIHRYMKGKIVVE